MKLSGRPESLDPIPTDLKYNLTPPRFMYWKARSPCGPKTRNMFAGIGSAGGLPSLFFDWANPPICEAGLGFDLSNPKPKSDKT